MTNAGIENAAREIVVAVSELPDRTSPDDWPDAMLVTASELHQIASDIMRQASVGNSVVHISAYVAHMAHAESIVNSDPVISVFAACEWDELNEDGKLWIAAIVRETLARAMNAIEAIEPDEESAGCPASWGDFLQIARATIIPDHSNG